MNLAGFVKEKRKAVKLTQPELAGKAGVGLRFIRELEQGKQTLLTGNAYMHLKNFSLLEQPGLGMTLSPAYDLVNTMLVNPADDEELALNLNGKKKN